ncbi:MAG: hypothetical protein KA995_04405 [Paludibacteraceae bacterium]|jgi:hypothetical protein|nr:hypothetical protein [Paludibacteraceae bacterium]MBP6436703.1 hypothetical protein [Paludibacteraceae bacterium]MBP7219648.1 hypothetical protein [Paludibacteraceae bacterium]MBP8627139.1 hypothetical protein [Paludibacteraceae bacterium]MBP8781145.1 hypothetical protein [Paludibacteraceae bacterium]
MEKEIKTIQKTLLKFYYLLYATLMLILIAGGFLLPKFDPLQAVTVQILNTISIALVLVCIPLGLKYFSDKTKKLKNEVTDKQTRIVSYVRYAKQLMFVLGLPGIFAGVSYYLIPEDKTSLFCFLMSFVALVLSKPTEVKLQKFFIE